MRKIITPEQMSLLGKNNPHQYPSVQELSDANVDNSSETANDSGEKFGNVILTELKKDGKNFIVAVKTVMQPRKGGVVLEVNQITTLFPKEAKGIVHWFNLGKATNIDKEKALRFIEALPTHPGTTIKAEELLSAANVVKDFETAKVSDEKVGILVDSLSKQKNRVIYMEFSSLLKNKIAKFAVS